MIDLTSKAILAASIRNSMFASRDTVDEALNYAVATIERLYNDDRAAMYTALHVVMNTIANKISALPDSSDQLPEPPPEVRIDHADLPATGEQSLDEKIADIINQQSLNEKIADIVDQRIRFQLNGFNKSVDIKIADAIEEWNENTKFDTIIEEWFEDNVDIEHEIKEAINSMSVTINFD